MFILMAVKAGYLECPAHSPSYAFIIYATQDPSTNPIPAACRTWKERSMGIRPREPARSYV